MGRPSGSARERRDAKREAPATVTAADWTNCLLDIADMGISVINARPILNGAAERAEWVPIMIERTAIQLMSAAPRALREDIAEVGPSGEDLGAFRSARGE